MSEVEVETLYRVDVVDRGTPTVSGLTYRNTTQGEAAQLALLLRVEGNVSESQQILIREEG